MADTAPTRAIDVLTNAWRWSRITNRVLREVELGDDLFDAFAAELTPAERFIERAPHERDDLVFRTARVRRAGQPGWFLRVTKED